MYLRDSSSASFIDCLYTNNKAGTTLNAFHVESSATSLTIIHSNPSSQTDAITGTPSKLVTCSTSPSQFSPCDASATNCAAATGSQPPGVICTYNCASISVADATCTGCGTPTTCSTLSTCTSGKFNSDEKSINGCESSFDCSSISITAGTCTSCSSSSTCTKVTCDTNKFNTDGDLTNGCEAGCAPVTGGTCTALGVCYTALDNGCTAFTCSANKFDHDGDIRNGCESDLPVCNFFLADDAALSGTNGYNLLTESCYMSNTISIQSGKILKIKKDDTVVDEIVIDRLATSSNSNRGNHFSLSGGTLEVEGVTLTGGNDNVRCNSF